MNIFNYLMNKKGHEIFKNNDILSYLLKKGRIHTASGTEITIHNAKGFNSLEMTKLSTQDGTPTPTNPIEVNTVKGYRNLFDITGNVSTRYDGNTSTNNSVSGNDLTTTTNGGSSHLYGQKIYVGIGNTVTMSVKLKSITYSSTPSSTTTVAYISLYNDNTTVGQLALGIKYSEIGETKSITFVATTDYIFATFARSSATTSATFTDIQVVIGEDKPYVPYGTNWIYTTITDGTNSKIITIPLNDNEVCGIGDYKDELIIDKNGHCWLNKKIGKVVLDGTESWLGYTDLGTNARAYFTKDNISKLSDGFCNYFELVSNWNTDDTGIIFTPISASLVGLKIPKSLLSTQDVTGIKAWLNTHNTIAYYQLTTPQLIDLNYNVDLTLYEGTNTITNSEDMDMILEYYK